MVKYLYLKIQFFFFFRERKETVQVNEVRNVCELNVI